MTKPKRKRPGAVGNRSNTPNSYPHPDAEPCRRCERPVDPQDARYSRGILRGDTVVCVRCLRELETQARRELEVTPNALRQVEAQIAADPRLLLPDHQNKS